MKIKNILLNKYVITILGIILIVATVIFINIKFKEHCINNDGKIIVGSQGYSCIYER